MMMAVIGGPPEHTFLRGRGGHQGDDELEDAAGLVRAMRKIAMVAGGDKEHAHVIERQTDDQIRPVKLQEEGGEASQMDNVKRSSLRDGDVTAVFQSNDTECHEALPFALNSRGLS